LFLKPNPDRQTLYFRATRLSKTCTKCLIEKPATEEYFALNNNKLAARCKMCDSEYNKNYRKNNIEKLKAQRKEQYYKDREKNIEDAKQWYKLNTEKKKNYDRTRQIEKREEIAAKKKEAYNRDKDKIKKQTAAYTKKRYKEDPMFNLKMRLRHRLNQAFKRYSMNGKVKKSKDYGIDYKQIIDYLGPCPGKIEDYHIDHIKPLKLFDFNDLEQVKLAFAPENHQWLTKKENLKKSSKFVPQPEAEPTKLTFSGDITKGETSW